MSNESIIDRIRKLLDRTTDNGCTEAEAMTAAAMAAKLMDKFNVTDADVIAGQDKASAAYFNRASNDHAVCLMSGAVARFTGCTIFRRKAPERTVEYNLFGEASAREEVTNRLQIVGLAHEVEIAGYLLDICYGAMEGAAAKALQEENEERRRGGEPLVMGKARLAWVHDFQSGMALRMIDTLNAMTAERAAEREKVVPIKGNGCDLVVVRKSLVKDWLDANGITLSKGRRTTVNQNSAFGAGHSAGGNVRFHSGVGSGQRSVMALR
jgi:hypothetical protein